MISVVSVIAAAPMTAPDTEARPPTTIIARMLNVCVKKNCLGSKARLYWAQIAPPMPMIAPDRIQPA